MLAIVFFQSFYESLELDTPLIQQIIPSKPLRPPFKIITIVTRPPRLWLRRSLSIFDTGVEESRVNA